MRSIGLSDRSDISLREEKRSPSLPPIGQVFEEIGTASNATKFGEVEPADVPSIGGSFDAGSRFARKPVDPSRRTRRR